MKYLLVLLVVGLGLWMLVRRLRGGGGSAAVEPRAEGKPPADPTLMVRCAQCGLHLASVDAVPEGSRLYCSDAHRRLRPGPGAGPAP